MGAWYEYGDGVGATAGDTVTVRCGDMQGRATGRAARPSKRGRTGGGVARVREDKIDQSRRGGGGG